MNNNQTDTMLFKFLDLVKNRGYRRVQSLGKSKMFTYLKNSYINMIAKPKCKLCNGITKLRTGYGRIFFQCIECNFVFTSDYNKEIIDTGMGMEGSWTGPGGGGFREYYLVKMLIQDLKFQSFLLFGTGNTATFAKLHKEGIDIVGCDISQDVVDYKREIFGNNSFFTPDLLPKDKKFDGIIAVEVFEHFAEPKSSFNLLTSLLKPNGIICGTTDFYPGGPIEDDNNPGYMSHRGTHCLLESEEHVMYRSLPQS